MLYSKSKSGFHTMPRDRARALSRLGTRRVTELANDYAFVYAGYIEAAVREVGRSYRQVAKWLARERIPAQRDGRWAAREREELGGALLAFDRQASPGLSTIGFPRQRTPERDLERH